MANITIGSGTTEISTQDPGTSFNVFIAQGGAILVGNGNGIVADGNNSIVVGGTVVATDNAIANAVGAVRITVLPTGVLSSSNGNSAVATGGATTVFNQGYIGSAGGASLNFSVTNDDSVINAGILDGEVRLGAGNDSFTHRGGAVNGLVDLGTGDDVFNLDAVVPASRPLQVTGSAGIDTISLGAFGAAVWIDLDYNGAEVWTRDDMNLGSGNAWRILADISGFENLVGGAGSDYLSGDANDNTFKLSAGFDTMLGDGGRDTLDPGGQNFAIWVDLTFAGTEVWTQGQASGVNLSGFAWRQVADLTSIESLIGTVGGDFFAGDASSNTFTASSTFTLGTPHDVFLGKGGTDTYDASLSIFGVWVDLNSTDGDVWTQRQNQVNLSGQTWIKIGDLTDVENIVGSTKLDFIAGDSGNNRIEGEKGADALFGRGGSDTFVYNLSAAKLEPSAQKDTIGDFIAGTDKIGITGLGSLPTIVIDTAPLPSTAVPTLLYNTQNGLLKYDSDGSNGNAAIDIATLTGSPALTPSDFILI